MLNCLYHHAHAANCTCHQNTIFIQTLPIYQVNLVYLPYTYLSLLYSWLYRINFPTSILCSAWACFALLQHAWKKSTLVHPKILYFRRLWHHYFQCKCNNVSTLNITDDQYACKWQSLTFKTWTPRRDGLLARTPSPTPTSTLTLGLWSQSWACRSHRRRWFRCQADRDTACTAETHQAQTEKRNRNAGYNYDVF